ncbi:hypothetical protein QBC34DRAFT_381764 [Podospora aff. communis PSN243]|uniref:Uncharacterized protein n=1 Tax=Podospora aff. communis PSN243 TaxID=3040156 RepID=A0AAV9GJ27_9PEZI|nr:hypothetical protein QBC34DRAFT_381764 [Podospora aff. communis PSN243]
MPFRRADAPATIPDEETIEWLLNHQNLTSKRGEATKLLDELNEEERGRTGLVKLGERTRTIQGDPFGIFPAWAGNVGHPRHYQLAEVLHPIFDKIFEAKRKELDSGASIQNFLTKVPNTDPRELACNVADLEEYDVVLDTAEELVLTFNVAGHSVRLMQARDFDKNNANNYNTVRALSSCEEQRKLVADEPMSIELQQYMMAGLPETHGTAGLSGRGERGFFTALRAKAREKYWLILTETERTAEGDALRARAPLSGTYIDLVRANWQPVWNNGPQDTDYFRQYLMDQEASKHVWKTVDGDMLIVIDMNRQVLFASFDELAQFLYGQEVVDLITRALDMWSFYTPLPAPKTAHHVVDDYIRRIHPELDPAKATGDPHGHTIHQSRDMRFTRSLDLEGPASVFLSLCDSVFAKTGDLVRFLMSSLDPEHYRECCEVWKKLPRNIPIKTCDEDFLSLFVLGVNGYTQRHRDTNDVAGGLAGLCTFGGYTGGALCLPQLGIKVPYSPGTCAIIRRDGLEHLVQDYSGPRFFVIGTNHESVRRHGLRMIGKLPPLPPRTSAGKRLREENEVIE